MNVRTEPTDRETDRPHELYVYVGLAQARPNKLLEISLTYNYTTEYIQN